MNLSELIHRSADESPSVVHSTTTYGQFQPTPPPTTTAADAMQLYNNEVLESRFVTAKTNDEGMYSPAKLLPMSSPTTSSSSWHYNPTTGESSRSPYASTLSDQSDRPRLLLPDSPPPASTSSTTTAAATVQAPPAPPSSSSTCSNTTTTAVTTSFVAALITKGGASAAAGVAAGTGGGGGGGAGTPASTDSPASPIPMDRLAASPRFTGSPEFHTDQNHHHHHHHHVATTINNNNNNNNGDLITSSNNSIASLYSRKNNNRSPILTITGQSVTKDNIEEGYVQFVLQHDPQSINDSIESLMYVKRKFSSVPKTGDLSYTTWDVFTLVKKLHNQQIKNWSQLVGQLGLSDMTGRPQFAQRVKRWMRKYRIDCYFDYLLGNPYNFHATDDKSSGCLTMGNYQKRRPGSSNSNKTSLSATTAAAATVTDDTDSVKSSGSGNNIGGIMGRGRKRSRYYLLTDEDDEDEEDGTSDDEEQQQRLSTPIVLAGSRKRSRMSPHQHVSAESMRFSKALQENNHRLSEPDDDHDDSHRNYSRPLMEDEVNNNDDMQDDDDDEDQDNNSHHDNNERNHINNNDDEMDEGDEEDELASTSSSSTVSQSATRNINHRPNDDPIITTSTTSNNSIPFLNTPPTTTTAGPTPPSQHPLSLPPPSSLASTQQQQPCSDCSRIQETIHSLRNDVTELKTQVASLQGRLDEELRSKQTMAKQISRFESMCAHYDNWRTKLAVQLLQNPFNMELMDRKPDSSPSSTP